MESKTIVEPLQIKVKSSRINELSANGIKEKLKTCLRSKKSYYLLLKHFDLSFLDKATLTKSRYYVAHTRMSKEGNKLNFVEVEKVYNDNKEPAIVLSFGDNVKAYKDCNNCLMCTKIMECLQSILECEDIDLIIKLGEPSNDMASNTRLIG